MSKFDELRKLAEAATPGPWSTSEIGSIVCAVHPHSNDSDGTTALAFPSGYFDNRKKNAEYIAAANPAAVLELLAIHAQLVEALSHPSLYQLLGNVEDSMDNATWSKAVTFMEARDAALAAAGAQP